MYAGFYAILVSLVFVAFGACLGSYSMEGHYKATLQDIETCVTVHHQSYEHCYKTSFPEN